MEYPFIQTDRPLNVLVVCESSHEVSGAFRRLGHNAYSCDLLPADNESDAPFHLQGDAFCAIERDNLPVDIDQWDLIIMHPPCTALCVSGNAHYAAGKAKHSERLAALKWTQALWETAKREAKSVAMENPVGVMPKELGLKATQYIQPYEYGHAESKKTGLWLHNLPKLQPTNVLPKPECGYWDNQTPSGQNKLSPSEDRWKIRSKTYTGIATAMAEQWT